MDKIKSSIREVFSLERIMICLAVFTVLILLPFYIVLLIVQVIKLGFIKLIMGFGIIGGACIAILALGVLLSLIYTIGVKVYNHYKYKDEYFYEDIDYEDEDTDE